MPDDTLVVLTERRIAAFRGAEPAPWGTPVTTPTPGMDALAVVGTDRPLLAVGFAADAKIHVFDPGRLAPWSPRPPRAAAPEEELAFAFVGAAPRIAVDDGARVAVADFDGAAGGGDIRLLDASRRAVVATSGRTAAQFMALRFVGGRVVFVGADGAVGAWSGVEAEAPAVLGSLGAEVVMAGLAIDGAGEVVAAGVDRGRRAVTIAAEAEGFAARPLAGAATARISAIAASGELVAVARTTAAGESEVLLHRLAGGTAGAPLTSDAAVTSLVFAGDGRRLAALREAAAPVVWDVATGAPIALMVRRPLDTFVAAEFAGGVDVLIGATEVEGAALDLTLWDLRSGVEIAPPLRVHDPSVGRRGPGRAGLEAAGGLVVSSSDDGVVIWDTSVATLRTHVCALAGRGLTGDERRRYLGTRMVGDSPCELADGPGR
jgi:hypothetical protein